MTCSGGRFARVGTGPAMSTATLLRSSSAVRLADSPRTRTAELKTRVPVSGCTVTVTLTSVGRSKVTPVGNDSLTVNVFVALRSPTSIGSVSMRSSVESTVSSPRTVTAKGSIATPTTQYPGATTPRSVNTTGTVRVVAIGNTGTLTTTTPGST